MLHIDSWIKKVAVATIFLSVFVTSLSFAGDVLISIDDFVTKVPESNLFLDSCEDVDDYDTVTLLISDGNPEKKVMDSFRQFGKYLGDRNAVCAIDVEPVHRYVSMMSALGCKGSGVDEFPAIVHSQGIGDGSCCTSFGVGDRTTFLKAMILVQKTIDSQDEPIVEMAKNEFENLLTALQESLSGEGFGSFVRPVKRMVDCAYKQFSSIKN